MKDRKIINNEERASKRKGHREGRGRHSEGETRGWVCEKIENRKAAISRVREGGEGEGKGRKKGLRDGMKDDVSTY